MVWIVAISYPRGEKLTMEPMCIIATATGKQATEKLQSMERRQLYG